MTAQYGLLGRKLGHSRSPELHRALAGYDYDLFPVEPEDLEAFLKETPCRGLNVTIPYKKAVIGYCTELSEAARRLGSVNTMVRRHDGWYGDNTDYAGFCALIAPFAPAGRRALVLGSGGAGTMALQALRDLGATADIVSRTGPVNYENMDRDAELIVNATPVGMWPETGRSPVELSEFPACRGVVDLIYNPLRTRLLLDAERRGIPNADGLWMLTVQAQRAAELFTCTSIPDEKAGQVYRNLRAEMENLVLIGMPGCGKSAVGAALAEAMGRPFLDADAIVTERFGEIPAIFANQGEDAFREMETQVLSELGKRTGCVIATGGGCVTRPENWYHLRQNGRLLWLRREIEALPTAGRPLSQRRSPRALYAEREPLYRAWAEAAIENTGTVTDTVRKIWEAIG